jgi:O-antigen/teichoic acid export membrane protein
VSTPESLLPSAASDVRRGVTTSLVFQLVAKAAHVLLNVASSLAIIHYLSPSEFGDFVLIVALVTLIGIAGDFGLDKLGVREVAINGASERAILGTVVGIRLALAVACFGLVELILVALGRGAEVRAAAAVASLLFVTRALTSVAISFHVRLEQQYEAVSLLLGEATETALVFWMITNDASFVELFVAPVVGGALAAFAMNAIARRRYRITMSFEWRRIGYLARQAYPLAVAAIVGIAVLRLDSVILAALRSRSEVGIYGAAYQPFEYILIANVTLATVLLPLLSRYFLTDPRRFVTVYRRGSEAVWAFALPIAIFVVAFAPDGVRLAYSDAYRAAVEPLRILAVTLVLLTVTAWEAVVLLAVERQRVTMHCNLYALGIALVVHPILIARFGVSGAAAGTVVVSGFTAAYTTLASARLAGATLDAGRLGRILVANVGVAAILLSASALGPWWVALLLAVVAYPALLCFAGVIRPGRRVVDFGVSEMVPR